MNLKDDIGLDLKFIPAWARQPPDQKTSISFKERTTARQARPKQTQRRNVTKSTRRAVGPIATKPDIHYSNLSSRQEALLKVSFIPERRGLRPLARLFAQSARAYRLWDIALRFLSHPNFFAVKIEVLKKPFEAPPFPLYLCTECQALFLEKEQALCHGNAKHFDLFYEKEITLADPPKGKFNSVARCGLSGLLLGPPNYHGYHERLLELHRSRFASLPLAEYQKKIINEADPAAIEQWKKEACQQITYRTRQADPALIFKRRSEAEGHFREQVASGLIREGYRFIISGLASRQTQDPTIKRAIQRSWAREKRFPQRIALALQAALRSYGLYVFKTPAKAVFISAIRPHPIDPSQTSEVIRKILEYLIAQPGVSRTDLVAALLPNAADDLSPVAPIINQLRWLIDKGHVIEFANGKLAAAQLPASQLQTSAKANNVYKIKANV